MDQLPYEVLCSILAYCPPIPLLWTCSTFHCIALRILQSDLQWRSETQLQHCAKAITLHPCAFRYRTRSLTLDLQKSSDVHVFAELSAVMKGLARLQHNIVDELGRLVVDQLHLLMYSTRNDPDITTNLFEAIALSNPRSFTWTTPIDRPHHVEIAIVQPVIPHLFRALSTCDLLTNITLTHLAFESTASSAEILQHPLCLLATLPRLETLHFDRVVCLPETAISAFLILQTTGRPGGFSNPFKKLHLVDVYRESIWGYRIRRSSIEQAAVSTRLRFLDCPSSAPCGSEEDILAFVRKVVVCESKTERLIGGDRADPESSFLF
ncbi:hypothetical protein DL96DRAFT_1814490 [Flagelloscypha sp. PMI_526]|nr:hypothetical protein DL96DRAFT_1814490 [Flagelloscypha sp. PMI_526]